MTALEDVQQAIERFSPQELTEFRRWFAEFEAQASAADRLDQFATEALRVKGKIARFSPEALTDFEHWFSGFEAQATGDNLDRFAIEALRMKGKEVFFSLP
ncbi:MAG: hypothetical protein AAF215_27675 [Cyanobacteria bacterium P01_A01_bin.123]